MDRQFRYALGIEQDMSENVTLGLACTFIDAGDASVN
jgi:hypothetical protein